MLDFQGMFNRHAEASQRAWDHDRTKTIGASEIGQCLRKSFFTKRGGKPDPDYKDSYGATHRGSLLEAHYVVPALMRGMPEGSELLFAGEDQRTLIDDLLSATPDGLITNLPSNALANYGIDDIQSNCILVEIKTFDSRINLTEPKPVHEWQVQQQFGLTHSQTNHRPEYAVILYVNASWVDDIRPFIIKRDPEMYEVCKKRAKLVYSAKDASKVQAEGKLTGKDCQYCPFTQACAIATLGNVPTTDSTAEFSDKDAAELTKLIRTEKAAGAAEKAAKLQKSTAAEAIKQWLRDHDRRFAKLPGGFSASYKIVKGRKSYDIEAMVEDYGIDLDKYTKEGLGSERLTVKAPGAEDDED
jgi:hypothetical protein